MNWARELATGLVDTKQLEKHGLISSQDVNDLEVVKDVFDIRVPQEFLQNIDSPAIRKQVIPDSNELIFLPEEKEDPIGDERWTPVDGVTHRYPDRVLLKLTHQCGVYCRFCFRRYKVSQEGYLSETALNDAMQYIGQNENIHEVILTGGDPLILTDSKLFDVFDRIAKFRHVKILRFHTRIISVLPSRISTELLEKLESLPQKIWIVAHINHADELTENALTAISKLQRAGIPLLSQSVLLRGINDSVETLKTLFYKLVECGVKPYYLHYPDLAKGTHHFRVPLETAISLMEGLRGKISGLCIPHLMLDIPGGAGKIVVEPQAYENLGSNIWRFRSPLDEVDEKGLARWIEVRYPACQEEMPMLGKDFDSVK